MAERVAKTDEIQVGEAMRVQVGKNAVCLVNLGEAGFRAVSDVCSHAEASLSEGEVDTDDGTIECPRHGSAFDLNSGKARALPATLPVATYKVTTDGGDILIEVT